MQTEEHKYRRTKIVATLGPATDSLQELRGIIAAGVDLVRLNFSHGSHESHLNRINMVREAMVLEGKIVGILGDLQGPKIRVACFKDESIELKKDSFFSLDASLGDEEGDERAVGIDYKNLPNDVKEDDILVLDDGRITLKVVDVAGDCIRTRVINGGRLSNHKGINRQGGGLTAEALTDKDRRDLVFALEHDVDYIALSFPRDAKDMNLARDIMKEHESLAGLIAKIERVEAVENIDEIIQSSDGVMVARGDLGVEIGDSEVPMIQKMIIQRARSLDKPVITATQMMESMIDSSVPTRAEVSDVANAVFDNTDAVMLSAETAVGKHVVDVVKAMSNACFAAERYPQTHVSKHRIECQFSRIDEAIAMSTIYAANHIDIKAIIAITESGTTSLLMSRIRTQVPIFAFSQSLFSLGKMSLYRGVVPVKFDMTAVSRDDVNRVAVKELMRYIHLDDGDLVILTKGDKLGKRGGTDVMKILTVGHVL